MIKKVLIDKANRLYQFPPDIFSFTRENEKPSLIKKTELIDLGRFNWNIPYDDKFELTPEKLLPATKPMLDNVKENISDWFFEQQNIRLDPVKEIYIGGRISTMLISSALAFIDNGDVVFVPELALPIYKKIIAAAGGESVSYTVSEKDNWLPDFKRLSTRVGKVARLLYLNSPHNPSGAYLNHKDLENLIWIASRENIAVINDAAYQSITNKPNNSLIGTKDGKKIGIEMYSFAYQFGLPQIPFGFAVGNKDILASLAQADQFSQRLIPSYYVDLAIEGINQFPSDSLVNIKKEFKKSRHEATRLIELLDLEDKTVDTIPFLWAKIERRKSAATFASLLYKRQRILCAPGKAFGDTGEGYIRFSLTARSENYTEACERITKKIRLLKLDKSS